MEEHLKELEDLMAQIKDRHPDLNPSDVVSLTGAVVWLYLGNELLRAAKETNDAGH